MENSPDKDLLERISYLEKALGNYGEQIRALNEAVETQQLSMNALNAQANLVAPVQPDRILEFLDARSLFEPKKRKNLSMELPALIDEVEGFSKQLESLKALGYGAYNEWYKLLEPNFDSYEAEPEAGISIEANAGARLFRKFVTPYAHGSVLDVGCGIASMPYYLEDFSPDLIFGSDPLRPDYKRDFSFHHGIAEILPWKDDSFDNVVVATSMDHFLDPARALSEMKRVLKPNGRLILWMGFVPGSKEYNPNDSNLKPVDDFHLFHFDENWFEPMLYENFTLIEKIRVDEVSVYYSCLPK